MNKQEVCFLKGSMIRTPLGEVPVENIQIGQKLSVFDWKNNKVIERAVIFVGMKKNVVIQKLPDDEAGWPVRVVKNAISDGIPYKDMLITQDHCLFFENKFIPVRMLVNKRSIFYDYSIPTYSCYHIETSPHSVIWADGMLTESYLDIGNRSCFMQRGQVAKFDVKRKLG